MDPSKNTKLANNLVILVALLLVLTQAGVAFSQDSLAVPQPVRTDGPRETIASFIELTHEIEAAFKAYETQRNRANRTRISEIGEEFLRLVDLSAVPEATRRERGLETGVYLLDIFGRIDLPDLDTIPTADSFDNDVSKLARWRIPHTPIEIVRIKQGAREGEFLFSQQTVTTAPRFFRGIKDLKLHSPLGFESWSGAFLQMTGPLIPAGMAAAMSKIIRGAWLGTPVWKIGLVIALAVVALFLTMAVDRLVMWGNPSDALSRRLRRLLTAIAGLALVQSLWQFTDFQIYIVGPFATGFNGVALLASYVVAVWLSWLVLLTAAELITRSPKVPDQSLDASLLRLCARLVGILVGAGLLAYAGNLLGLPVFSLIAGLGVGGLAVALAIRPTLENLVGGLILYADRPVRVGDFCKFDQYMGTIESIGVRSTHLRALDRTLISVPNAKLADMEIVNWAQCDQMLINTTIGLRYETEPDQLRYVLAALREMLIAHPKIDRETVRVRLADFGASSLDVDVRVYAQTREWNDFYAVREDVLLRIAEIVNASGTGFAFPSQTLYVRRDPGLDEKRSKTATDAVKAWRRAGKLPFPYPSPTRVEEIAETLDYPPRGSFENSSPQPLEPDSAEPLSAEPGTSEDTEAHAGSERNRVDV